MVPAYPMYCGSGMIVSLTADWAPTVATAVGGIVVSMGTRHPLSGRRVKVVPCSARRKPSGIDTARVGAANAVA